MISPMRAFLNADIYARDGVYDDHALLVEGSIVADIVKRGDVPAGVEEIDAGGMNIAAGFVDLQVNGGGGVFFNEDQSEGSLRKALEAHQRLGTTAIFPTVFTSSFETMQRLLHSVSKLRLEGVPGLAGIHFEGPVIEASKAGVHDRDFIQPLSDTLMEFFTSSARTLPTLVTLAPEHARDDQLTALRSSGVLVFAGHTNAGYDRIRLALASGLQGGTHLFNAMSAFGSREPGVVGALLADDDAYVSVIADGHHVHWASLRASWKSKASGKMFCVTDAMPCVGSSVAEFDIGSLHVQVRNGRCETDDGTLAGSALDMATAVRNLTQKVGVPLPESLRMANVYPAKFAGLSPVGHLVHGAPADFIIFDNQVRVSDVYVGGRPVI